MNCQERVALSPLYHSGELDARNAAAFAAHLRACAACAREIQTQSMFDARLREAVLAEETDTAALDRRVLESIIAGAREPQPAPPMRAFPRRWWAAATALAVALVLVAGGFGYRALLGQRTAPVYSDAAQDHQDEVVDHQPRKWHFDLPTIQALAARELVPQADVAVLASHGFRLERGKLCRLNGQIYLHLVYQDGKDELSVFLRQRNPAPLPGRPQTAANGRPLYTAHVGREHVAAFDTDRLTAVVVSTQSNESALDFASFAAGVL